MNITRTRQQPTRRQNLATPAQMRFIENLVAERASIDRPSDFLIAARLVVEQYNNPGFAARPDKHEASRLIDGMRLNDRVASRSTGASPAAARTNRYPGRCVICGTEVAAEAGRLDSVDGRWVVKHNEGECSTEAPETAPALPEVPAGHYAIKSTGENDLAFYRVDRPTEGDYAGRVFVKLVVGGHPDRNVARHAVPGILARIVEAGVSEAALLYGREIGRCCVCNRTLTDAASRAAGIGPDCAGRV